MKAIVFREEHFNAAYRLHDLAWSDEKNDYFRTSFNPNFRKQHYELVVKYPVKQTKKQVL